MAERKKFNERNIEAESNYIEGSVNLESGDVIGGDKITGMNSKEIIELIEVVKKNLMPKYLNPKHLAGTLKKFNSYHAQLYEWKELHNGFDEILNSFHLFYSQINRLNGSIFKPNLKNSKVINELRLLWSSTEQRVDDLLAFSRDIKLIGVPFQEINGQLTGEKWAIDVYFLCSDMQRILYSNKLPASDITRLPSWQDLYDLTDSFYNTTFTYLHIGDKKLRKTATELLRLSETLFQR